MTSHYDKEEDLPPIDLFPGDVVSISTTTYHLHDRQLAFVESIDTNVDYYTGNKLRGPSSPRRITLCPGEIAADFDYMLSSPNMIIIARLDSNGQLQKFDGMDKPREIIPSFDYANPKDMTNHDVINCRDGFILHDGKLCDDQIDMLKSLCKGNNSSFELLDIDKVYRTFNNNRLQAAVGTTDETVPQSTSGGSDEEIVEEKITSDDSFGGGSKQCGEYLATLLMTNLDSQSNLSSSEDSDDEGRTTTTPRRRMTATHSPLRISPNRMQPSKKAKDNADVSSVGKSPNTLTKDLEIGTVGPESNSNMTIRDCMGHFGFDTSVKNEDGTINPDLLELQWLRNKGIQIPDGESRTPSRTRRRHPSTAAAAPTARTSTTAAATTASLSWPASGTHSPVSTLAPAAASSHPVPAIHTPASYHVDVATAARLRVQQTSPRITAVADTLSEAELSIEKKGFKLDRDLCRWVRDSPPLGECAPYSADEKRQVMGKNGILFNYFPLYSKDKTDVKSNAKKPRKSVVEFLVRYACKGRHTNKKSGCQCMLYIARKAGAILAFVKVDERGEPVRHSDHDFFPIERTKRIQSDVEAGKRAKFDELSLSCAQKEFVLNHLIGSNSSGNWHIIAEDMIAAKSSRNLRLTQAQENDPSKFANRIRLFWRNELKDCCAYLTDSKDMTAEDMKMAIEMLSMDDPSEAVYDGTNEFLKSDKFKTILRVIKVVGTDYGQNGNGYGDFTFLHFEYRDASKIAALAVKMFPDGVVQVETDFFKGVAVSDKHQCGHIGFSDLNHRYWLLGMGIFLSESGDAATHLLSRAVSLLKQAGGGCNVVLQDGSHALNAGIDNVNDILESEMKVSHLNMTDQGVNTNLDLGGDKDNAIDCELYDLLHDTGDDNEDWDTEIDRVVRILKRRRCFIHCMRTPYSRGGGYRGGRGSIPRSCLNAGMSYKELAIVTHKLMCVNYAPCREIASEAIRLITAEHNFSDHVIKEYLNGNPLDLGGRGAGRDGECGSAQGVEKKGGNIKSKRCAIIDQTGSKDKEAERNNFLNLMLAFAHDKIYDTAETVAVTPDRSKLLPAYKNLITLSRSKKMPADWLLSFCMAPDVTGNLMFVNLCDVLGKKDVSFEISWPTASRMATSTRLLLERRTTGQLTTGLMCLQLDTVSDISDHGDLTKFHVCSNKLERFGKNDWEELKQDMKGNFLANTNEPHANESSLDYLRRKCQRYSELDAENDMLIRNSIKNSGKPPSKKKKKKKGKGKQQNGKSGNADRLEEDKWGKGTEEEITIDNSKEEVHEESHLCFDIGIDSDGVDDILNYYMNEAGISFDPESKRELEQMEDRNKRVKVKRELGDWITCTVKDGKITCNCERYVYWRDCKHVVWMEVLHLNQPPPESMQGASDNWVTIREQAVQVIKKTSIRI